MKSSIETLSMVSPGNVHDAVMMVVHEKFSDAWVPGFWVEFSPDEAQLAGAFAESALGPEDAMDSSVDLLALSS